MTSHRLAVEKETYCPLYYQKHYYIYFVTFLYLEHYQISIE